MEGALYNGVISGDVAPIAPFCPSGNCTWPTTPSLAVCGECNEVEFSVVGCYKRKTYGCDNESMALGCDDDMFCNYSLASGNYAEVWNAEKYIVISAGPGDYLTGFYSLLRPPKAEVVPFRKYLISFDLFGLQHADGGPYLTTPASHHCSLWTCVQYYATSVESGQYNHKIVATNGNGTMVPKVNDKAYYTFGPVDIQEGDSGKQVNYTATFEALRRVQVFLSNSLIGSVNMSFASTQTGTYTYTNELMRFIWSTFSFSDLDAWIKNVATSMTNVIRSNDQSERPEYNGSQYELAVKVRWLWIILPATLVLSSVLFMITVMIRTAHSPVRSWKGSPLTLLLFDLDLVVRDAAYDRIEEYNGVEETVGGQTVRLVENHGGRRAFVAA